MGAGVARPGPRKTGPLDLTLSTAHQGAFDPEIPDGGTGALYREVQESDIPAGLGRDGAGGPRRYEGDEEALEAQVEWLVPGLVWAMDDRRRRGWRTTGPT